MSSLNQEESDAENSELDEYVEEDEVKRPVVDEVDNDNSDEEEEEEEEEDEDEDDFGISSSQNMDESILRGELDMGDEYMDEEEDDDDSDDEQYLQKFDEQLRKNIVNEYHPELIIHSNDDIQAYTRIVKNDKGIIVDPLHTTLPFVTKYERARILGERTKQLNAGAKALVEVEPDVIDGYLIALKEFEEKKIPFIVKRPMPNGGCEYWKLKDLEII